MIDGKFHIDACASYETVRYAFLTAVNCRAFYHIVDTAAMLFLYAFAYATEAHFYSSPTIRKHHLIRWSVKKSNQLNSNSRLCIILNLKK